MNIGYINNKTSIYSPCSCGCNDYFNSQILNNGQRIAKWDVTKSHGLVKFSCKKCRHDMSKHFSKILIEFPHQDEQIIHWRGECENCDSMPYLQMVAFYCKKKFRVGLGDYPAGNMMPYPSSLFRASKNMCPSFNKELIKYKNPHLLNKFLLHDSGICKTCQMHADEILYDLREIWGIALD